METLLKKPEIKRDPEGRFERHGKTLSKTQKKTGLVSSALINNSSNQQMVQKKRGGARPGAGRPKGSPNRLSATLKEMILQSLDDVGGREYLARLAIENSSAYSSLLGKVLPSTLAMPESSGGIKEKVTFERVIVWPDGHREVEGVTPKQLPKPQQNSMPQLPEVGEKASIESDNR